MPRANASRRAADAIGVRCAASAADAVRDAGIVISAVTAASSIEAVQSVVPHLTGKPFLLDINSVSPGRKQEAAKLLGGAARYVDVAVIAPIHPARHQTPMLIAGSHAEAAAPILTTLGMRVTIAGAEVGAAAAIKMVRSVMIKGIEALTLECFLAAARAGVVDEVAASLKNNYPGLDWSKVVPYNLERMASHGERRAAEMEEVAETLARTWRRTADDRGDASSASGKWERSAASNRCEARSRRTGRRCSMPSAQRRATGTDLNFALQNKGFWAGTGSPIYPAQEGPHVRTDFARENPRNGADRLPWRRQDHAAQPHPFGAARQEIRRHRQRIRRDRHR